MIRKIFPALLILTLMLSCDDGNYYTEHYDDFDNHRWYAANVLEFKPEIATGSEQYDVILSFRHVYGFQYRNIKLDLMITSPSGNTEVQNFDIQIVGNNNEYISECAGDICDIDHLLIPNYQFTDPGVYTFAISHPLEPEPMRNVMEVGLILKDPSPNS